MFEIIPSINVRTFEEVQERIKKIEPYVTWCHLDVTDGVFSKHLTWHNPADLPRINTNLNVEAHLMVVDPEKIIDQWLVKPVKRIIVHAEAVSNKDLIIKKCRDAGVQIGIAINPETFWGTLEPWFSRKFLGFTFSHGADIFQVLTVHPGPSGQVPNWPEMLGKIQHIRAYCKRCIIEVDGGINHETTQKAVEAGANLFVSGAYIFDSGNIEKAIQKLIRHQ